eukprot:13738550-Alexandrium_andersonii.AAC.1
MGDPLFNALREALAVLGSFRVWEQRFARKACARQFRRRGRARSPAAARDAIPGAQPSCRVICVC